jgi:hypothetical protein
MFYKKSDAGYKVALEGIRMKTLVYGKNTLLTEFRLERGRVLPKHRHPHEQTGYLVSGRLNLIIGDETFPVGLSLERWSTVPRSLRMPLPLRCSHPSERTISRWKRDNTLSK